MSNEKLRTIQDALISVTNDIPVIMKTGEVKGSGNKTMYKHETIEGILLVVRPILKKHDCAVYFFEYDDGETLGCRFIAKGIPECIEIKCKMLVEGILFKGNAMQEKGSGQTYARRYLLRNLFNLSCEDDDTSSIPKQKKPKAVSIKDKVLRVVKEKSIPSSFVSEIISSKFYLETFSDLNGEQKELLLLELQNYTAEGV